MTDDAVKPPAAIRPAPSGSSGPPESEPDKREKAPQGDLVDIVRKALEQDRKARATDLAPQSGGPKEPSDQAGRPLNLLPAN